MGEPRQIHPALEAVAEAVYNHDDGAEPFLKQDLVVRMLEQQVSGEIPANLQRLPPCTVLLTTAGNWITQNWRRPNKFNPRGDTKTKPYPDIKAFFKDDPYFRIWTHPKNATVSVITLDYEAACNTAQQVGLEDAAECALAAVRRTINGASSSDEEEEEAVRAARAAAERPVPVRQRQAAAAAAAPAPAAGTHNEGVLTMEDMEVLKREINLTQQATGSSSSSVAAAAARRALGAPAAAGAASLEQQQLKLLLEEVVDFALEPEASQEAYLRGALAKAILQQQLLGDLYSTPLLKVVQPCTILSAQAGNVITNAWRKPNPHAPRGGRDKVYTDMYEFITQDDMFQMYEDKALEGKDVAVTLDYLKLVRRAQAVGCPTAKLLTSAIEHSIKAGGNNSRAASRAATPLGPSSGGSSVAAAMSPPLPELKWYEDRQELISTSVDLLFKPGHSKDSWLKGIVAKTLLRDGLDGKQDGDRFGCQLPLCTNLLATAGKIISLAWTRPNNPWNPSGNVPEPSVEQVLGSDKHFIAWNSPIGNTRTMLVSLDYERLCESALLQYTKMAARQQQVQEQQ